MSNRTGQILLLMMIVAGNGCGPAENATTDDGGETDVAARDDVKPHHVPRGADAKEKTSSGFPGGRMVDLTHPFNDKTIYWPTAEGFKLTVDFQGVTDKGYYYSANNFCAAEHGGTHIDAPIHFFADRETLDAVPLENLVGPAVLIDVREKCKADPDYQIGVDDLHGWEERHGRQLVDVIVLLRTGFYSRWPSAEEYLGTAEKGPQAVSKLHFPGLAPEAAKWLVEHRAIRAIGIDTASIDYGQSQLFQSHVTLFSHNVPAFENVANLGGLPEVDFSVMALPMKISGGSGGPLRIVAVVPE